MGNQKYEAFVTAARTGSFKRAAEELGYTQAGVSYMMNALEQELGLALFVRDHAGVRLTADGENLLPWVQDICTSERAFQTRLEEIRNVETGSVRVATFASIAIHWVPGIVDTFLASHPKVDLSFTCYENQAAMEEDVRQGNFDCCFTMLPSRPDFFVLPLAKDPIHVVLATDHPLAHARYFPREALAMEPYIRIRNESYSEFDAVFDINGVQPNTRFVMDNDYAIMGMVSKGLGFSLFPELILHDAPFDLARLQPEVPTHRELGIAVRSFEKASSATRAFIECAQKWVAQHTGARAS